MRRAISIVALIGVFSAAPACIEREARPVNPCTNASFVREVDLVNVRDVDLLFMVDNSGSMDDEQRSLAAELPLLIRVLTSGDFNEDGDLDDPDDFEPVSSLHVGVITSDMGTGGFTVNTCARSDYGDDGVLRTQGRTDLEGCMAMYPSFLTFDSGSGQTPDRFAEQVACVSTVGVGGCGFEQQLEAILKALTPAAAQPWTASGFMPVGTVGAPTGLERPFYNNTPPHGAGANAGFVREGSVLAIIPVTDEEDCSAADATLFDPSNRSYHPDLNIRCFSHPQALHPIQRYVNGFLQLRERPEHLIYAPITGIPIDLAPAPGTRPDWEVLVSDDLAVRDDRMEEVINPDSRPLSLYPSCNEPERGVAYPPLRIVRVARDLEASGAGVTVQSICDSSYRNALREIIRRIKNALGDLCLPRPLNPNADGSVDCDVVATLPEGLGCDAIEGAVPRVDEVGAPVVENGRAACIVPPRIPTAAEVAAGMPPSGTGWFYDDYTTAGAMTCQTTPFQRVGFVGMQLPSGARVRLECFQSVEGGGGTTGPIQIGTFCDPSSDDAEENPCPGGTTSEGVALSCDPVTRACGVQCETDADCRSAGLSGYVCDKRARSEVDPQLEGDETPYLFCVNPTC